MEAFYTSHHIDIWRIECNTDEIDEAIKAIKKNYPCISRLEVNILDKDLTVYIYYFCFNGKRAVSTGLIDNIYEINNFVTHKGTSSFSGILKKLKKLATK